jgi:hypothetical protein
MKITIFLILFLTGCAGYNLTFSAGYQNQDGQKISLGVGIDPNPTPVPADKQLAKPELSGLAK